VLAQYRQPPDLPHRHPRQSDHLPWRAAKVCFESQRDFHYLSLGDLQSKAVVDDKGIHISGMNYSV